jgi:hypothetical protein
MSTTETTPSRSRREGLRTGWIVLLSLLTLIPLAVWKEAREPDDPVELVEAFFEALRDKDVDRALGYTDASVPTGEEGAFLHPDAVGDEWEVLDVSAVEDDSSWETEVRVRIGHPEGFAVGRYVVRESDGELVIEDPLQSVSFATSSQLEMRVNDRVVELDSELHVSGGLQSESYKLLPGVYRFFGGDPVTILDPEQSETPVIRPPEPDPTAEQVEAVQGAVEEWINACVEYRMPSPEGCPFASDGYVDTSERERLEAIEDVTWTVVEYPEAAIAPGTDFWGQPALVVEYPEPGRLELSGIGTSDHEHWKEFTAACHFGGALVVLLRGEDGIELAPLGVHEEDTCRGTE